MLKKIYCKILTTILTSIRLTSPPSPFQLTSACGPHNRIGFDIRSIHTGYSILNSKNHTHSMYSTIIHVLHTFAGKGIWLLGQPRRYKHYANKPQSQCCVIRTLPVLFHRSYGTDSHIYPKQPS